MGDRRRHRRQHASSKECARADREIPDRPSTDPQVIGASHMSTFKIGILGAGIGGLTAAIALHRAGHDVVVYEQSKQFLRVGADINLTPNAVRALDGLGIADAVRRTAARPTHRISRTWDSGEETSRLEMGDTAEK